MKKLPNKILGGANLFSEYGISQHSWKGGNLIDFLNYAYESGFDVIDTASAYEGLENSIYSSEGFIDCIKRFRVGTKLIIDEKTYGNRDKQIKMHEKIERSLGNWKQNTFEYIYCHNKIDTEEKGDYILNLLKILSRKISQRR